MSTLQAKHFKRYAEIGFLLIKYGRGDIVAKAKLSDALARPIEVDDASKSEPGKPEQLATDLEEMGPVFIKLGQLLSTRSDLLPLEYLNALSRLQDDIEPFAFEEVKKIVESELNTKISKAFLTFSEKPMATASLGQVHRATLRSGKEVVVKVQRPGAQESILEDLEALTELAAYLHDHVESIKHAGLNDIVKALKSTIVRELNYKAEANNARTLRSNLVNYDSFVIPQPIQGYVSERILTMEYQPGTKITDLSGLALLEKDQTYLADQLFDIYLHQILVDGIFHSDPHPGNLLLTPEGKIALLDFGMVTEVPRDSQRTLLKFLLAISDNNGVDAADAAIEIGTNEKDFDKSAFSEEVSQLLAQYVNKSLEELNTGRLIMSIRGIAGRHNLALPIEVTMLGKTLMNLDQSVEYLDPKFDPHSSLKKHAEELFQKQATSQLSLNTLFTMMLDSADLAQNLPSRLNKFSELVASNSLKLKVDSIDEDKLLDGIQKIANRISAGLIVAALIIGASLLMNLKTTVTILGYPAFALSLFLIAAGLGLILVYKGIFVDK